MDEVVEPQTTRRLTGMINGLLVIGSGFIGQALVTVTGIISARMLGVEGRGQVAMGLVLATMSSQLTLGGGLPNAITTTLVESGAPARDALRHVVGRWASWSFVPAAAAAGYYLLVDETGKQAQRLTLAGIIAMLTITAIGLRLLFGTLLGEDRDLGHVAVTVLLPQVLFTLVVGVAFVVGASWGPLAFLGTNALCAAIALIWCLRYLAPSSGAGPASWPQLRSRALRTHLGSVGPIDGLGLDRMLVGTLLGNVALGLYAAAAALATLTSMLGTGLAAIALPRVARSSPAELRATVAQLLVVTGILLGVTAATLSVVAEPVIRLAFGSEFVSATPVARWLVVAGGLLGFRRVLIAALQGVGAGGRASVVEAICTSLMILGVIAAGRADQVVWAGVTMTLVAFVACAWLAVLLSRAVSRASAPPVSQ